jgi:hypothetical protein
MRNRPPRPPSGRSWGQARWSDPPTPPTQATQPEAHDALNQELPAGVAAGLQTLAIDGNNSHSCCGMIKAPAPPSGRPWGPARRADSPIPPSQAQDTLSPARPAGPGLRWRTGLQYPWLRVNRVSSPRQFPVWFTGRQCPGPKRAIRVSSGSVPSGGVRGQYSAWSVPGRLAGPQYPMPALSAARPLGPSLQRTTKSASVEIRVA